MFSSSPFAICLNPSSTILVPHLVYYHLFCVFYYFEAFFSLKVILRFRKNDIKYRDIAPLIQLSIHANNGIDLSLLNIQCQTNKVYIVII